MKRIPQKASTLTEGYFELTKPRITSFILISTALGYYLGSKGSINYFQLVLTLIGSGLVSSGSGVLNHYAEMKSDKLMDRTRFRPLPSGLIKPLNALIFGVLLIFSE